MNNKGFIGFLLMLGIVGGTIGLGIGLGLSTTSDVRITPTNTITANITYRDGTNLKSNGFTEHDLDDLGFTNAKIAIGETFEIATKKAKECFNINSIILLPKLAVLVLATIILTFIVAIFIYAIIGCIYENKGK